MDYLIGRLTDPLLAVSQPGHRIYWIYLVTAILLAFAVYGLSRPRTEPFSLANFVRFCLPRSILLHRSARLDYWYFVVNRVLFGLLLLPVVGALGFAGAMLAKVLLQSTLGSPGLGPVDGTVWILVRTLAVILAIDFGLFLAHYLQHRVPVLWEFHKVHHSAQVLTPVTAYRMHPVDDVLSMGLSGLCSGLVLGVFEFLQPGHGGVFTLLGLNALLFAYYVAGYNLRHSHIWLSYGAYLSRVLVSPAQHQIHHSKAPIHWNRNFGFIFSFWDGLFGTLYVPKTRETIEVGLPDGEDEAYSSIRRLYFLPFARCFAGGGAPALSVALIGVILIFMSVHSVGFMREVIAREGAQSGGESAQSRIALTTKPTLAAPSVFLEDLTWTEVRDLIGGGHRVAIVPTGGTEQNGPHMILGKHNYVVRYTAGHVARRLGNALVAPAMAYVPEGSIDPPGGHMRYAGTISLSEPVFEAVLEETARSLKAHGFSLILFLGDSGWNQSSQERVAAKLNKAWGDMDAQVLSVGDYYFRNGQTDWLKAQSESDAGIGTHAGIRDTSELMFVHRQGVREQALRPHRAGDASGADGDPTRASADRGRALLDLKIEAAVRQIQGEISRLASQPASRRAKSAGTSPLL